MIYDSRDSFYKTPFGAVSTGTAVSFCICLPDGACTHPPRLQIFDSRKQLTAQLDMEHKGQALEPFHQLWCCSYTPTLPGLWFYTFVGEGQDGAFTLLRDDDNNACWNQGRPWQLTVYESDFATPAQMHGAVFYQIFPDRFCRSGKNLQTIPKDRILHQNWYEEPVNIPDAQGEFLCNDYFGGDLEGIRQNLPYLSALGVEVIYLNPIFEAHSNHRYNTADYLKIDPLLGCEEDFRRLCSDAAKNGIRIILDGVFNHTGSDSVYFNKEGRYGNGGAYHDPQSPYYQWFSWHNWPGSYDCWWNFATLPNVNEDSKEYQEFICGEQGVVRHWLRAGASGFRLDVADELPDWFIQMLRGAIKAEGEDKLILGEVWEDASTKFSGGEQRQYLMGRELDSVMNYPWRNAILDFVRDGRGIQLKNAILEVLEHYPSPIHPMLMNCLSTHDVSRAITALAAPSMTGKDRDWQREHNQLDANTYFAGRQLFLLASIIQYTLPGCPSLYYGDEAGLYGYADPFNRGTYPWGKEDQGLVEFFRILGNARKNSPVLRLGDFIPVAFDRQSCTYLRSLDSQRVLVCVNRGQQKLQIPWNTQELEHSRLMVEVGGLEPGFVLCSNSAAVYSLPSK